LKPSNLNEGTETFIALFDLETDDIARTLTGNEETEAALKAKGHACIRGLEHRRSSSVPRPIDPRRGRIILIHVS